MKSVEAAEHLELHLFIQEYVNAEYLGGTGHLDGGDLGPHTFQSTW